MEGMIHPITFARPPPGTSPGGQQRGESYARHAVFEIVIQYSS